MAGIAPATIGRRDANGYFWVHDRKKNLIISGGRKTSIRRKSSGCCWSIPMWLNAGVIGRFDPKWDEVPVAYVIRRAGVRSRKRRT